MNIVTIVISLAIVYILTGIVVIITRSKHGTDDQKEMGKIILRNPIVFIPALVFWVPLMYVKKNRREGR